MPEPRSRRPQRRGPPLEVRIAFLLSKVGRRQSVRFAELLKPFGLRPKHFAVMNVVDLTDGPSQQQLGAALGLDPSGLISTIDDLEAAGLLERRRTPDDRRRHALCLTRAGQARLATAREASRKHGQELITPLSDAEAQTLHDLLQRIASTELDLRPGADWE
jgi:DNA-binding MarR family transcriptional regulator